MLLLQEPISLLTNAADTSAVTDSIAVPNAKEQWELLKSLPIDDVISHMTTSLVDFSISLAVALLVFTIGKFVIKRIHKIIQAVMVRRQVEKSLTTFVLSLVRIVLYFILLVTVIGILGIETSSFIAIFASAGVAVGMALSGTLQNFAGGVLILLLKPYRVGDYIEAQGYAGTVTEIQIFSTIICTPDNKSIIIPNGGLSTGSINNWSRENLRRVDWEVSISYGENFDLASKAILDILDSEPLIIKKYAEEEIVAAESDSDYDDSEDEQEKPSWWHRLFGGHEKVKAHMARARRHYEKTMPKPAKVDRSPVVLLETLGASSVDLKVRAWVKSSDYWTVYYTINKRIYAELPRPGISFPFPQMDVHITQK